MNKNIRIYKIEFHKNGHKCYEKYYTNNKLHREDGPAIIYYHENGNKKREEYHINGTLYNKNGPASE